MNPELHDITELMESKGWPYVGTVEGVPIYLEDSGDSAQDDYVIPSFLESEFIANESRYWYVRISKDFQSYGISDEYPPELEAAILEFCKVHHKLMS